MESLLKHLTRPISLNGNSRTKSRAGLANANNQQHWSLQFGIFDRIIFSREVSAVGGDGEFRDVCDNDQSACLANEARRRRSPSLPPLVPRPQGRERRMPIETNVSLLHPSLPFFPGTPLLALVFLHRENAGLA